MRRLLRFLYRLWAGEPPRMRRRIGFVPPGQESELVPIDDGGDLEGEVVGGYLSQDVSWLLDE